MVRWVNPNHRSTLWLPIQIQITYRHTNPSDYALIKSFSDRGDKMAAVLLGFLNQQYWVSLTSAAEVEASDSILVSGQLKNVDGTNKTGAAQLVLELFSTTGSPVIAQVTDHGTVKSGANSAKAWIQTLADGSFQVTITLAETATVLIQATTDNGVTEMITLSFVEPVG